jgi:hypothetical protein
MTKVWLTMFLALLNLQWSQMSGPQTPLEKIMFWTLLVGGGTSGFRYFQVSQFRPPWRCKKQSNSRSNLDIFHNY